MNAVRIVFPVLAVLVLVVLLPATAWAIGWLSARTPRRVTIEGD